MIKFFRKIRQNLLTENKTGKYFKYAVGEIVLVVIGILIALQINNWNGERKAKADFDLLISATEQDLKDIIKETTSYINIMYSKDSLIRIFSLDTISLEGVNSGVSALPGISNLPIEFENDNIELLSQMNKNIPKNYSSMVPMLTDYILYKENQKKYMDLTIDHANDYWVMLADNYPWFGRDDSIARQERLVYRLNDYIFRNHLRVHQIRSGNNVSFVTGIRSVSLQLLLEIKRIRDGYNRKGLIAYSQELGMGPFSESSCDNILENTTIDPSLWTIYHCENRLDIPITVNCYNDKGRRFNWFRLDAKESKTFSRLPINTILEVVNDNDECIKKYTSSKHGYLLIE